MSSSRGLAALGVDTLSTLSFCFLTLIIFFSGGFSMALTFRAATCFIFAASMMLISFCLCMTLARYASMASFSTASFSELSSKPWMLWASVSTLRFVSLISW